MSVTKIVHFILTLSEPGYRVIGSAADHNSILANPSILLERITGMDRDEKIPDIHQNTAFKILSIEIDDVNIAADLGARMLAGRS